MKNRILIILVLAMFLQSCKGQKMDVDKIIAKYDTADFTELKNKSIHFRSAGNQRNSSIYFVNIYKGECSPYAVELNNDTKTIIEVKNHLVLSSCKKDYLSKEEIEQALKKYKEYNLCLVQVDEEGNVYINPNKQESPILLRKLPNSIPKDLDKFKLYKGNWYVRK